MKEKETFDILVMKIIYFCIEYKHNIIKKNCMISGAIGFYIRQEWEDAQKNIDTEKDWLNMVETGNFIIRYVNKRLKRIFPENFSIYKIYLKKGWLNDYIESFDMKLNEKEKTEKIFLNITGHME